MKILLQRAKSVEPSFRINGFIIDDAATEIDPIRYESILQFHIKDNKVYVN